jgi:hypothetical protein
MGMVMMRRKGVPSYPRRIEAPWRPSGTASEVRIRTPYNDMEVETCQD